MTPTPPAEAQGHSPLKTPFRILASGMDVLDADGEVAIQLWSRLSRETLPAIVERVNGYEVLVAELQAYRDAARYDVQMSGPKPMGWDLSQLERARKMTEAALSTHTGGTRDGE